jgi:hypothetical protein
MPHDDQLLNSVKFLLKSVKQLSDRFLDSEAKLTRSFDGVAADVNDLLERLERVEKDLSLLVDGTSGMRSGVTPPALPVRPETQNWVVPAINLPIEDLLNAYHCTPILLEPFARPCAVNGRTLTASVEDVEIERFAQGLTWALETLEGGWILLPRPGSLDRRTQVQALEWLFEIEGQAQLPANLQLVSPGKALAIEHSRSWKLLEKGKLTVTSDPLRYQSAKDGRLAKIEKRLSELEQSQLGE